MGRNKKIPLKSSLEIAEGYTFNDKRAGNSNVLYNNPNMVGSYRPRVISSGQPTDTVITEYDRITQLTFGRELYSTMPNLGSAIISKNQYAVGSGWNPSYNGKNKEWADIAEKWLNDWFKVCNVLGQNFDFRTSLFLSGTALDVDGDSLLLLTNGKNGYPQIQLIGSNRIGSRNGEKTVKGGSFDGYEITDGVVINSLGRPIGYKILAERREDDYIVGVNNCQLLLEPEWSEQYRGISRIARAVLDCLDIQDIDEYIKRQIKLQASVGVIHHTESGEPDQSSNLVGMNVDLSQPDGTTTTGTFYNEQINGGDIYYMKAGTDEKLESFQINNPATPTADFLNRIERRTIASVGWSYDLLDPSKVGGASVRLVTDIARASIRSRQMALERRAKLCVTFALGKAMELGLIPDNRKDRWFDWSFTKPQLIVTDAGYEEQADRDNLKQGTTTLQAVAAKKGLDWYELRNQRDVEADDLVKRIKKLAQDNDISYDKAEQYYMVTSVNLVPAQPVDN